MNAPSADVECLELARADRESSLATALETTMAFLHLRQDLEICTSATLCFLFLCLRDRKMGACSPGVLLLHLSRVQSGRLFSAFVNIITNIIITIIVFSNIFIILIIAMFLTKHKEWLQSFWLPRRQLLDRVQKPSSIQFYHSLRLGWGSLL